MAKVRNLSDNQQEIAFTEFDLFPNTLVLYKQRLHETFSLKIGAKVVENL